MSVLSAAQWCISSQRPRFSVKNQKMLLFVQTARKVIELQAFEFLMVFRFFLILFSPFSTKKKKNFIHEIPILQQNLNINN